MAKTYKHIKNKYISTRELERRKFLQNAKNKYGKTYNYNNIIYVNARTPITIHCNKHQVEFRQERRNHLRYFGCKVCAAEKHSLSQEEFIKRSKVVYGDRFDYSLVKFKNTYTKVTIICKEHGPIEVIPYDHMRGKASCSKCTASSFEKSVYSLLETLKIPYIREYKIEGFDYRYDVLIPDVKLLIEIHGPQHYEGVTFYNGTLYEDRAARDKDKATIAKSNNFAIVYINCIKYGNNVKKELLPILRSYLKYYKDGRYYKSFADFAVYNKLPNDARPKDYQSYKTTF